MKKFLRWLLILVLVLLAIGVAAPLFVRHRIRTQPEWYPKARQAPKAPQGPPGPPGQPVRTVAVCGGGTGSTRCSCTGREIARQVSGMTTPGCSVTSDTGTCSIPTGAIGICCVCAP